MTEKIFKTNNEDWGPLIARIFLGVAILPLSGLSC